MRRFDQSIWVLQISKRINNYVGQANNQSLDHVWRQRDEDGQSPTWRILNNSKHSGQKIHV